LNILGDLAQRKFDMKKVYSERKREAEEVVRPFVYDDVPQKFRTQLAQVLDNMVGQPGYGNPDFSNALWCDIMTELAIKDGVAPDPRDAFRSNHIVALGENVLVLLDLIEIALQFTDQIYRSDRVVDFVRCSQPRFAPREAIQRLNECFASNDMGYVIDQESMEARRLDSEFVHAEVVEPAFNLLRTAGYDEATEHFRKAHRFHRTGDTPNAIAEASKAFESVLKEICDANGWQRTGKENASGLIQIVVRERLIPAYNESQLVGFDNLLQGLPTIRNKEPGAGHGAEPNAPEPNDYLASYAIGLAAANIVVLVEAQEAFKSRK
jgi:hypothetical protein